MKSRFPMPDSKHPPRARRVLLIDNYDSFTYNLVQRLGELGAEVEVVRNDALAVEDAFNRQADAIVISPGPCTPNEAGISVAVIIDLSKKSKAGIRKPIPLLGVCLGHQAIGQAFGAEVVRASAPVHGKAEEIFHDGKGLFKGAPAPLFAGRYHSLVVDEASLPRELTVTARTRDGVVMALQHKTLPVYGVQFHPESILTPDGQVLLANFLAVRA